MADKMELYRAVKYQVQEYGAAHGYTLPELWRIVNDENADHHIFWLSVVVTDYLEEVVGAVVTGKKYHEV